MRKIAVDTNILVRILIKELSEQGRVAEQLLASSQVHVSKTVLLESEWVMRSTMKIERKKISEMMQSMLRLPAIEVEDLSEVEMAIEAHAGGMDFADALHVAGTKNVDCFTTFDRSLARRAKQHFEQVTVELAG